MKKNIYSNVFMWLFIGLLITFGTGMYISDNAEALKKIFSSAYIFLIIAEVGIAIFLSARIGKMSSTTAKVLYLLYTALSGLTFSAIFVVYKLTSIMLVFGITSALFLIFALIGRFTKVDLTKIGTYLFMILLGVIICSIINIFIGNTTLDIILSTISIVVFLEFIAFDIKKIESLEGTIDDDNLAVYGAFQLYLDFINIFIDLLRIFGDTRD